MRQILQSFSANIIFRGVTCNAVQWYWIKKEIVIIFVIDIKILTDGSYTSSTIFSYTKLLHMIEELLM